MIAPRNVSTVCLAAAALLLAGMAAAQTAPAFDVVSIKPAAADAKPAPLTTDPGRLAVPNATLQALIERAYDLEEYQLSGGPDWIGQDKFDLEATTTAPATREQEMALLRQVLAERFHVALKTATHTGTVYSLLVGNAGAHLQPLPDNSNLPKMPNIAFQGGILVLHLRRYITKDDGSGATTESLIMQGRQATMAQLCDQLGASLRHPVTDQTGIAGAHDFGLHFAGDGSITDANDPDLRTALREQLGLRLQAGKGPNPEYVVTHAERPSGAVE